jgi:flavin-dependent dehydrogenase
MQARENEEKMIPIPACCDVVVIGGGPAGSSVAALLAKAGIEVVLLEKTRFPRNQVGESLIPHFWKFADLTGVSEKIEREKFITKAGGIIAWDGNIHQIAFSRFGYRRPALHVERDRFDTILLRHAESLGAQVSEEVLARRIDLSSEQEAIVHYHDKRADGKSRPFRPERNGTDSGCPKGRRQGWRRSIVCRIVVDASGPSSLLANQLNARQSISSHLKFIALWGYFKNARYLGLDGKSYGPEQLTAVKPATFVQSYRDGWVWHIILRNSTSVGMVIHTDRLKGMDNGDRKRFFLDTLNSLPYLQKLLAPAEFIEGSIQFRPDYSYYSTQPCGANFYCIGDAAGFVDPIYSHGVQNAFYNAATAAAAIQATLHDPKNRHRYSRICQSRMQQFYSFSRSLALGDHGGDGINRELVKSFMRSMPPLELELMLAASEVTNRADNFRRLAHDAGLLAELYEGADSRKAERMDMLDL